LKLLPIVDPGEWKVGDAFLSQVGLFHDERYTKRPLPTGVCFSGTTRKDPFGNIDYTSFTCGACHIGRVFDDAGETYYIDGGINSEFNIAEYYVKLHKTLATLYGDETDPPKQKISVHDAFMEALVKVNATRPNYFYEDYGYYKRKFDEVYEAKQIQLFKDNSHEYVDAFFDYTEGFVGAYSAYMDKTYDGFQS
jgi:hypothetical protein